MGTYTDRVVKSVTHYTPGPLPLDKDDIDVYLINELQRLGDIIYNQATFRLERTHDEPQRPREGDVRYADGTNWNPGGGEGIYFFRKGSPGSWIKLG